MFLILVWLSSCFPHFGKQAAVVPIFRKGSSAFMSNFPSIAALNNLLKVLIL